MIQFHFHFCFYTRYPWDSSERQNGYGSPQHVFWHLSQARVVRHTDNTRWENWRVQIIRDFVFDGFSGYFVVKINDGIILRGQETNHHVREEWWQDAAGCVMGQHLSPPLTFSSPFPVDPPRRKTVALRVTRTSFRATITTITSFFLWTAVQPPTFKMNRRSAFFYLKKLTISVMGLSGTDSFISMGTNWR